MNPSTSFETIRQEGLVRLVRRIARRPIVFLLVAVTCLSALTACGDSQEPPALTLTITPTATAISTPTATTRPLASTVTPVPTPTATPWLITTLPLPARTPRAPTATPTLVQRNERVALEAFYASADGANWVNNGNWLSEVPVSGWHGVRTDITGRVVRLDLHDNGLSGTISAQLASLTNLTSLDLSNNQLSGEIPVQLARLPT